MAKKRGKRRKRRKSKKEKAQERLKRRLKRGPLGDRKVVVAPEGQVKMSEVLEDFVEPYRDEVEDTLEVQKKLLSVALVAWNAALLPEEARREMVEDMVEKTFKEMPAETKQDFREIVGEMIARKLAHFAEYKRAIIDFDLTEVGTGYHLTVISTMDG